GASEELLAARGELPISLIELVSLKGLGPKKVKVLYDKLGLRSLGELEYACNENRLLELPGFGPKAQAKLLSEIQILKTNRGKQILSDALMTALEFETRLSALKPR